MVEHAATPTRLSEDDLHLFNEGTHYRLYEHLGSHVTGSGPTGGTGFAVWAPEAGAVSVVGDFNGWDGDRHPLHPRGTSGIWETFVPGVTAGAVYKYRIRSMHGGEAFDKADPFAFRHELPPATASVVHALGASWRDDDWMRTRGRRQALDRPIAVYEVHLPSWRRGPDGRIRGARAVADELTRHVQRLGFTHVQLMPVMHHPYGPSWGYQLTGYYAVDRRLGTPEDLMFLIDTLHRAGVGVILDWVPSHFAPDAHGLARFDGSSLYEHADPRQGFHPDWGSCVFNYGRHEVRSFLVSNAIFWLDRFHADGLRVDAVASMLYLNYSREDGAWIPNEHGGRENLGAVTFLEQLNREVYRSFPDVQTIAEESTAWPGVTRPVHAGGLGFGLKWDMGWMHDALTYLARDPVHRRHHHRELTFRGLYQFDENYMLALSHDEVVHGKGSLVGRMPGDDWHKFANLRLLLAHQWLQPGKKLLFMGGEIGQWSEWDDEGSLDWALLEHAPHGGIRELVAALNRLYRDEPALHEQDCDPRGFAWLEPDDAERSIVSFFRRGRTEGDVVLAVLNATPVPRTDSLAPVPFAGVWREILNTDARPFGGTGLGNLGRVHALDGSPPTLRLTLPPLAAVLLRPERPGDAGEAAVT